MDSKPQLTENEIMCRNLMERNGEIGGLRKWAGEHQYEHQNLRSELQ